jgi:hypothetical protein
VEAVQSAGGTARRVTCSRSDYHDKGASTPSLNLR